MLHISNKVSISYKDLLVYNYLIAGSTA